MTEIRLHRSRPSRVHLPEPMLWAIFTYIILQKCRGLMSSKTVQISAVVSEGTKSRLDRLTRATGLKKARIIETALNHHMLALAELPTDVIIPSRIVVDRKTGKRILQRTAKPAEPTEAMRELFSE